MKNLINYLSLTISQFFRKPEVRREICQIASSCSGGGGGLTEVSTANSPDIAFTGDGTSDNPLSATITGGVIQTATNGIQTNGTEIKLGVELAPPFTNGLITEPTLLVGGNIAGGQVTGLQIDPTNDVVAITVNDPFSGLKIEENQFSLFDSTGRGIYANTGDAVQLSSGGENIVLTPTGTNTVSSLANKPLDYGDDYSANYTSRSLVDKGYVDTKYKGGQSLFTADGTTTEFDIIHNLGAIPPYFTLTTTTPISLNHLNRTITFPDNNTMRITFTNAPLIGEDVNYVWIVYK